MACGGGALRCGGATGDQREQHQRPHGVASFASGSSLTTDIRSGAGLGGALHVSVNGAEAVKLGEQGASRRASSPAPEAAMHEPSLLRHRLSLCLRLSALGSLESRRSLTCSRP